MKWKLLTHCSLMPHASIIEGKMKANNIPVMLLNKLDSSYQSFGSIEVWVEELLFQEAEQILKES